MKAKYNVNRDLQLELEGATEKELVENMAHAQELFAPMACCGCCVKPEFKPRIVIRQNKDKQKFYELWCTNPACGARFCYGQSKDMKTLFPQRKFPQSHVKAGEVKPDGGWVKEAYGRNEHDEE